MSILCLLLLLLLLLRSASVWPRLEHILNIVSMDLVLGDYIMACESNSSPIHLRTNISISRRYKYLSANKISQAVGCLLPWFFYFSPRDSKQHGNTRQWRTTIAREKSHVNGESGSHSACSPNSRTWQCATSRLLSRALPMFAQVRSRARSIH